MITAIIPARGGSKGIPRKNIIPLCGKPLIHWTIDDALRSRRIDKVVVSTDDEGIANVSKLHGAEVSWRPAALAGDHVSSELALVHTLLDYHDTKIVVFLQATSPLRREGDLNKAIDRLLKSGADSLLSVAECHRFLWINGKPVNYDPFKRPMRQDINQFVETGSFYVFRTHVLESGSRLGGKIITFPTPWYTSFEIDTNEDLELLEFLMGKYHA